MLSPTRRTFLTIGAFAATLLVSGCTDDSHRDGKNSGTAAADADRPVRARAVAATDTLLAAYDGVIAGPGAGQADLLNRLRTEVAAHRAQLAQGLPSSSPSASRLGSGSGSPGASPSAGAPGSVAALAVAERQTATARLADLDGASPALAKLLASVSASNALHATLLGDNGTVTPAAQPSSSGKPSPLTASTTAGLQSALAAEHAAVYGYGVVGAFLPPGPQREDGRTSYAAHQARRDAWQRIISGSGATPAAAAAGYRLPFQVKDAAGAARLAAHIESQLTVAYADLVAAATGPMRTEAAGDLREAVLRASHWGAQLPALPGIAATEPAAASAAPSASQSA